MPEEINFKNKKITVMGLGLHGGGVAVTKWLAQKGADVLVTDLRDRKTLKPSLEKLKRYKIQFVLGKHRAQDFQGIDLVIKNPGVSPESKFLKIAKKNKISIETDISLFFRMCPAQIIGITGTKGKSTTTSLVFEFFKSAGREPVMAGNIRISPLEKLAQIKRITPVILELSSWQLEDMTHLKKSPHLAVITNILPDHLNRYRSMSSYVRAKKVIFKYQNQNDFVVLNYNNPYIKQFSKEIVSQRYWFSVNKLGVRDGCYIKQGWIVYKENSLEKIICHVKDLEIPGQHNLENALAAISVAKISGISNIVIKNTLRQFKGIPDRLELIRRWKGKEFYNDTTATAPAATLAALASFDEKIILIGGGSDKNLSYRDLAKEVQKKVAFLVLLKGSATRKFINELEKIGYKSWQRVSNLAEAVDLAYRSDKGRIILFSPAAASFNMFLNEFDRGDQFKKIVVKFK